MEMDKHDEARIVRIVLLNDLLYRIPPGRHPESQPLPACFGHAGNTERCLDTNPPTRSLHRKRHCGRAN